MDGEPQLGVAARLRDLVARAGYDADPAQEALAGRFDILAAALADYGARPQKPGPLRRLFGAPQPPPRGLYVHGEVGRGKTMLMDLFFEAAPIEPKRRLHANAFMSLTHGRLHAERRRIKREGGADADPVLAVAASFAAEARLLCFDEFSVRDIADAMIVGRLFTALFDAGVVVVATSNVAPDDLYEDGLNRALFLPFIALLKQRLDIVELDAAKDFRLEKLSQTPVYLTPDDAGATAALDDAFRRMTGLARGEPADIERPGRILSVPQAAPGVARFGFADLCRAALGADDYLAVAERFHTILLDHVPVFDADGRNEAKRFIALIDVLYDARVKLVVSAAAEPDALGANLDGVEAFEFRRTASRLVEMRSRDYLAAPHGRRAGGVAGVVET